MIIQSLEMLLCIFFLLRPKQLVIQVNSVHKMWLSKNLESLVWGGKLDVPFLQIIVESQVYTANL